MLVTWSTLAHSEAFAISAEKSMFHAPLRANRPRTGMERAYEAQWRPSLARHGRSLAMAACRFHRGSLGQAGLEHSAKRSHAHVCHHGAAVARQHWIGCYLSRHWVAGG